MSELWLELNGYEKEWHISQEEAARSQQFWLKWGRDVNILHVIDFESYQAKCDEVDHLREEVRRLQWQYDERGMAMRETGDMVRSLYEPKIKIIREILNSLTMHPETALSSIRQVLNFSGQALNPDAEET